MSALIGKNQHFHRHHHHYHLLLLNCFFLGREKAHKQELLALVRVQVTPEQPAVNRTEKVFDVLSSKTRKLILFFWLKGWLSPGYPPFQKVNVSKVCALCLPELLSAL